MELRQLYQQITTLHHQYNTLNTLNNQYTQYIKTINQLYYIQQHYTQPDGTTLYTIQHELIVLSSHETHQNIYIRFDMVSLDKYPFELRQDIFQLLLTFTIHNTNLTYTVLHNCNRLKYNEFRYTTIILLPYDMCVYIHQQHNQCSFDVDISLQYSVDTDYQSQLNKDTTQPPLLFELLVGKCTVQSAELQQT